MIGLPLIDRSSMIWLDGVLVPWERAQLHVLSQGLQNALTVFEGERAYGGRVFRFADHTARLFQSANALAMKIPFTTAALDEATDSVVRAIRMPDVYVRPVVWRGDEHLGPGFDESSVHVAIAGVVWQGGRGARPPVRLTVGRWRRPPGSSFPAGIKASASYVVTGLCLHEARLRGFDDAILLDPNGMVAEATGANVFAHVDGVLVTPTHEACLPGITRRVVIELARDEHLPTVERTVSLDDLARAEEIFLTGTATEIAPVVAIDDRRFPAPGPITERLARRYRDLVRS